MTTTRVADGNGSRKRRIFAFGEEVAGLRILARQASAETPMADTYDVLMLCCGREERLRQTSIVSRMSRGGSRCRCCAQREAAKHRPGPPRRVIGGALRGADQDVAPVRARVMPTRAMSLYARWEWAVFGGAA